QGFVEPPQLGECLADTVVRVLVGSVSLDQRLVRRQGVGPAALECLLDRLLDKHAARLDAFLCHHETSRRRRTPRSDLPCKRLGRAWGFAMIPAQCGASARFTIPFRRYPCR